MSTKLNAAKQHLLEVLDEGDAVVLRNWEKVVSTVEKGGPGSGHYGHSGRPGRVGGSAPGTGGSYRRAVGVPASLDSILTRDNKLTGHDWQTVADARASYAEFIDILYDEEPGTLYERAVARAKWRNERLKGTESYEESLAMSIRREVQMATEWSSSDVGVSVREHVRQGLMEEFGISAEDAYDYTHAWNISSWDDSAVKFQRIAWELSGREDLPTAAMMDIIGKTVPSNMDRLVFNEIYGETQKMFKARGMETVTLYRGIQLPVQNYPEMYSKSEGIVSFRQGPLSSWSFDPYMATCFGNCAVAMEVPVERIWSMGAAGVGTFGEFEAVVFEGVGDDEVSYKWQK